MSGFRIEAPAQLLVATELFVREPDIGADVPERTGQLIVMGIRPPAPRAADHAAAVALRQCASLPIGRSEGSTGT